MKFLTVFLGVLALASAYTPYQEWTLSEIEAALQDPNTDPAALPILIDGLNTIVHNMFNDLPSNSVVLSLPVEETMTLEQLTAAIHDPQTDPAVLPYLEDALGDLMVAMNNGQEEDVITLSIPAMTVTMWTMNELSLALQNPATDPELAIYLEHALNQIMVEMFAGNQVTSIAVLTPPGVIASVPEVIPTPVVVPETPLPIIPSPVVVPETPETPVVPVTVPEAAAASAPLVQIIVNVNAKQESVNPSPVAAVEEDKPIIAVNPAGWEPATVEGDKPIIAVNPAGWEPAPIESIDQPIIAVGPWA